MGAREMIRQAEPDRNTGRPVIGVAGTGRGPRGDDVYDLAFANGAIGGKVSGAGGGGFMMFIVPPCRRIAVVRALNAAGGNASGVHLTSQGAESWTI